MVHYSGDFRGEYVNPGLSGAEALGVVRVSAHPYQTDDRSDRFRILLSGLIEGWPGYVANGRLSLEEATAMAQATEEFNNSVSPDAENRRQVDVQLAGEDEDEATGVIVYDSSIPLGGLPAAARPSGKLARMTAYAITSCAAGGKSFTRNQLRTMGAALGYGALLDMQAQGFERVRHQFVGLGSNMSDKLIREGILLSTEAERWLSRFPWLK